MATIGNTLQSVGTFKATTGLYMSPVLALCFCCIGFWLVNKSSQPAPPTPAPTPGAPAPPPNKPPPAGFGYLFICIGFFVPLLAYGTYKLTMSSPTFAKLQGANTAFSFLRT